MAARREMTARHRLTARRGLTNTVNDPCAVGAGNMRKGNVALAFAAAHPDIEMIERRSLQTENYLARPGCRFRRLFELEDVGGSESMKSHCLQFQLSFSSSHFSGERHKPERINSRMKMNSFGSLS